MKYIQKIYILFMKKETTEIDVKWVMIFIQP